MHCQLALSIELSIYSAPSEILFLEYISEALIQTLGCWALKQVSQPVCYATPPLIVRYSQYALTPAQQHQLFFSLILYFIFILSVSFLREEEIGEEE